MRESLQGMRGKNKSMGVSARELRRLARPPAARLQRALHPALHHAQHKQQLGAGGLVACAIGIQQPLDLAQRLCRVVSKAEDGRAGWGRKGARGM